MKYKFEIEKDLNKFDEFVINYKNSTYTHLSSWAKLKSNWHFYPFVVKDIDDNIVASSMSLVQNLAFGFKLMYIPRSFLIDYNNDELLKFFIVNIKTFCEKNKIIFVKIDPEVCINQDNIRNILKNDNLFSNKKMTLNLNLIDIKLKQLGFKHKGLDKNLYSYFQPRFNMAISLKDENDNLYTEEKYLKLISSSSRNYIKKHKEKGVYYKFSNTKEDLLEFCKIMNITSIRKNVSLRNETYFKKFYENFKNNIEFIFGYIDLNIYEKYLNNLINDKNASKDKTIELIDELNNYKKIHNVTTILTSACMLIKPINLHGIKIAHYLYAGNDLSNFKAVNVSEGLVFAQIKYCLENEYDFLNLGGVDGDLKDKLTIHKSHFAPDLFEYVGEYDLPINFIMYKLFEIINKIRIYKISKRAKKKGY